MIGAHSDSPCLKVKPNSKKSKMGYDQVGVETYGGGLWHTWFDRDLSLAGRVFCHTSKGIHSQLVRIEDPILRIPSLAIHLDRTVNDGFKFNNENQLAPILALSVEKELNESSRMHAKLLDLLASKSNVQPSEIGEFELCLYDTQHATIGGLNQEFIYSARLDNLMMSFCSISALLNAFEFKNENENICLVALFDNEEIGSQSAHGADSNFLETVMHRLCQISFSNSSLSVFEQTLAKSFLVSADMAHAIHPNYSEKHEENHRPLINKGVVIKENANQRYATNAVSSTLFREAAKLANVQLQDFVVRNDSPCGSTIGPMISAKLGLRTIDVGNPQLSMHSIREQCGVEDMEDAIQIFQAFFKNFNSINSKLIQ